MECGVNSCGSRKGFALVTVLIVAAIGLLIGAGFLLRFRFQCQLRIDRQHELEKYFAVRSVINVLSSAAKGIEKPDEFTSAKGIVYQTDSQRNVSVVALAPKAIFPDVENANHFYVRRPTKSNDTTPETRTVGTRYAYAVENMDDKEMNISKWRSGDALCLMAGTEDATNGLPRCWLKLDMSPTGRWTDDLFGRRYRFNILGICKLTQATDGNGVMTNDTFRFILKRQRVSDAESGVTKDDWHPVDNKESVIFFEYQSWGNTNIVTMYTQTGVNGVKMPVTNQYGTVMQMSIPKNENDQLNLGLGIQLVGKNATLFTAGAENIGSWEYDLSFSGILPDDVFCNFTNDLSNANLTTNMMMVVEIEGSPCRTGDNYDKENKENSINKLAIFEAYPAYEYSIAVDYPYGYTNDATVVHLKKNIRGAARKAITYDAHGTLNKGWRTDEKDWREYNEWLKGRPNTEANRTQWQRERGKFEWR